MPRRGDGGWGRKESQREEDAQLCGSAQQEELPRDECAQRAVKRLFTITTDCERVVVMLTCRLRDRVSLVC